uniref:Uncharacterized protein n=1 Tax=Glossina austeni TaxID=7395 RepID=A0A1A9VXZ5_GLOAU
MEIEDQAVKSVIQQFKNLIRSRKQPSDAPYKVIEREPKRRRTITLLKTSLPRGDCRRSGTGPAVYMSIQNRLSRAKIYKIKIDNTIKVAPLDWLKLTIMEANITSNTYFTNSTLHSTLLELAK